MLPKEIQDDQSSIQADVVGPFNLSIRQEIAWVYNDLYLQVKMYRK